MNWTVAMEAALRGISPLSWNGHLLWPFTTEEKPPSSIKMTVSLWQHLRFIEAHSRIFSSTARQSLPEQLG